MGWRGTFRSINATMRRIEREERTRYRQLARELKESAARREMELAEHAVARYQAHIEALTSVHQECGPTIEWPSIASLADPALPPPASAAASLIEELNSYQPNLFSKFFGTATRKRRRLEAAIAIARSLDEAENATRAAEHRKACDQAREARALASAVINGDLEAYRHVMTDADPFEELREVGVAAAFDFSNPAVALVTLTAQERSVVPSEQETLTARGKLTSKRMPKSQGNEIYQDYLCGAALRACRETLALLPVEWVIVTVCTDILNTRTGHMETPPVLSLAAPRATMARLRFETLDPSEAMSNFLHRMNFKKTAGMTAVVPLVEADLQPSGSPATSRNITLERGGA